MGVACQLETLTLPNTWFGPYLGLAFSLIVQISFPELAVIIPTFFLLYCSVLSRLAIVAVGSCRKGTKRNGTRYGQRGGKKNLDQQSSIIIVLDCFLMG